jgi:alpha/beta superfamily hydrolase
VSRSSKLIVPLVVALASLRPGAAEEKPAAVVGLWKGTLRPGPVELRLVLKVRDEGGALIAALDSLDQGAKDIRVDTITRKADSVSFAIAAIRGSYSGTISADGTRIEGTWSQGAASLPLVFERTETVETIRRPQEPMPPFPYKAEDVVFKNAAGGVELAGTLTLPASGKPFPAAVLLSGSGPQDRDEALMGHRPFFVLADHLTRLGIAVLRFDDRGVARSTGDFAAATTEDFATDALAGLEFLKRRPEIDPARVGLIGHSEGGLIAPMVAARSKDVAFLVLIAAPSLRGEPQPPAANGRDGRSVRVREDRGDDGAVGAHDDLGLDPEADGSAGGGCSLNRPSLLA